YRPLHDLSIKQKISEYYLHFRFFHDIWLGNFLLDAVEVSPLHYHLVWLSPWLSDEFIKSFRRSIPIDITA
ncbi:hypothetical protein, partial [Candidatus Entotheonella palauensis]|uniref:hypothetical protein n=1 Tax=Candidatus Entotheonella palauensis TaxID=93172 RepID=UPI001C4DF561